MPQESTSVRERSRVNIDRPRRYYVVFHNDDFTTMEIVVEILMDVFLKSESEAEQIMWAVHSEGKGLVGPYRHEIAESRRRRGVEIARSEGYPLNLTLSPEE